ncbi:MAG: helix-turn-helix domain-containing protein [Halobacteriota archaeon]
MPETAGDTDQPVDCDPPTAQTRDRRQLFVELEVSMAESCPARDLPESVTAVNVIRDHLGQCHCDIRREANEDPIHVTEQVSRTCACSIFAAHGCVPKIEPTAGDRSRITTYLPNRTVLGELIEDLRENARSVSLLRIVDCSQADSEDGLTFDLTDLSETQRDTLELAVTEGYYDDPRGISLAELAEKLGVSKSGVSRRLSRIEATILTNIISKTLG